MFSAVITLVYISACLVISKFTLSFSASDPVEAAVHCLEFSGHNGILEYAYSGVFVYLDGGFWLGPFHFLQCVSHCHHLLSSYEKCPEFCF